MRGHHVRVGIGGSPKGLIMLEPSAVAVVEKSQMSRPSVDDGQLFAEPHRIGRWVRFKLLAQPAAAYDDACLPVCAG